MTYVLLGFLVLAAVLLLSRWIARTPPATLVRTVRWTLIALVASVVVYVVWIGRYQLAAYALPFLIPAFVRWRLGNAGPTGAGRGPAGPSPHGAMTREEAYAVLGLQPGADEAAVREAHRRLMTKLHPDRGGSDYLAAKVNQARDVLLGL